MDIKKILEGAANENKWDDFDLLMAGFVIMMVYCILSFSFCATIFLILR